MGPGGPPGRGPHGGKAGEGKGCRDDRQGKGIPRRHAEQLALYQFARHECPDQPHPDACRDDASSLGNEHADDAARLGADRETDGDLAFPLPHGVSDDPVDADKGEQRRGRRAASS